MNLAAPRAHNSQHSMRTLAVGDDDDAAAELGQRCAEGAQRLSVQVVGRLIQHHHVRVLWLKDKYESACGSAQMSIKGDH